MNDPFGLGLTPELLLGTPTWHLPMNLIVQDMGDDKIIGVFQCNSPAAAQLKAGSEKTHQLVLADVFVRPQLVFDSNEFRGRGISSLTRDGFMEMETWQKSLILDRSGQFRPNSTS